MRETICQLMLVLLRGKKDEDYAFTREDGSRVVAPRKEWYSLCVSSGLGKYELVERKNGESYKKYVGLNPHDFRRSALRNMTRRALAISSRGPGRRPVTPPKHAKNKELKP
jgi:hypothetical protein